MYLQYIIFSSINTKDSPIKLLKMLIVIGLHFSIVIEHIYTQAHRFLMLVQARFMLSVICLTLLVSSSTYRVSSLFASSLVTFIWACHCCMSLESCCNIKTEFVISYNICRICQPIFLIFCYDFERNILSVDPTLP